MVEGPLLFRILSVLEKNPSKADLLLKCTKVFLSENRKGENLGQLPILNVVCTSEKVLGVFRNTYKSRSRKME